MESHLNLSISQDLLFVKEVKPFSFELNDVSFGKIFDGAFSQEALFESRVSINDLVKLHILLDLVNTEKIIEFDSFDLHGEDWVTGHPSELWRVLEVFVLGKVFDLK